MMIADCLCLRFPELETDPRNQAESSKPGNADNEGVAAALTATFRSVAMIPRGQKSSPENASFSVHLLYSSPLSRGTLFILTPE